MREFWRKDLSEKNSRDILADFRDLRRYFRSSPLSEKIPDEYMTKNCPIILVTLFQRFRLNNETLSQAKNFIKTMDQFWNTFIKEITRTFFWSTYMYPGGTCSCDWNYWSTNYWSRSKIISKMVQNRDSILRSVFEQNIFLVAWRDKKWIKII